MPRSSGRSVSTRGTGIEAPSSAHSSREKSRKGEERTSSDTEATITVLPGPRRGRAAAGVLPVRRPRPADGNVAKGCEVLQRGERRGGGRAADGPPALTADPAPPTPGS